LLRDRVQSDPVGVLLRGCDRRLGVTERRRDRGREAPLLRVERRRDVGLDLHRNARAARPVVVAIRRPANSL
jgi:hypothetical protein